MAKRAYRDRRRKRISQPPIQKESSRLAVLRGFVKRTLPRRGGVRRHWRLLFLAFGVFLVFFYFWVLVDIPKLAQLSNPSTTQQSTKILDRNGKLLYNIYATQNRTIVPLSEVSTSLKQATIAIEDKDFYRHGPLDPRGIARAMTQTVFKRNLQGGSTITQQLVKVTLLSPERTIQRKIKEVLLAFFAESFYSKDKILELYLSQAPYGGATYGVETAAETYFGKKAKDLTLAESTLLAGLPASPTLYSPFGAHPELAKRRQKEVLRRLVEDDYITNEEAEGAEKEDLHFSKSLSDIKAPHFVLYAKQLLVDRYGEKIVEQGGLKVTTTLDLDLQEYAQASVSAEIAKLSRLRVFNGAALVTKPGTGEILAMVGSKDYFANSEPVGCEQGSTCHFEPNVNVTLALRQPGSAIKPINYAAGLGKGVVTASSPFVDKPTCFPNPGGKPYCPVNYDGRYHGTVQLRFALGNSYNIPAVKMLKANGVFDMIATASAMGITSFKDPDRYGLSLTLGGGEVSMLEMAQAFGVFANGGYRVDLVPILKVEDASGKVLEEYKPPESPFFAKKAIPEAVAFLISHILLDNNARSSAFGGSSELVIPGKTVSVKTGTTDDKRDNWTVGYTSSQVVVAWVGNNDNTPMNPALASGVTGAAPIWNKIMRYALRGQPNEGPRKPDTIVGATVCADYGNVVASSSTPQEGQQPSCPTRFEYFIKGFMDPHAKVERQQVFIDKATGQLAKEGQTENVEMKEETVLIDPSDDRFCSSCPLPPELAITPTP